MRGAIPTLLQYAFAAWCSVEAQGQLYLSPFLLDGKDLGVRCGIRYPRIRESRRYAGTDLNPCLPGALNDVCTLYLTRL